MRNLSVIGALSAVLLLSAIPLFATSTAASLSNECPQVGQALGCPSLVGSAAQVSVDRLVGSHNNSGSSLNLSGYTDNILSGIHLTGGLGDAEKIYLAGSDWSDGGDDGKDCDSKDWDSKSCKDGCDSKDWDSKSCEDSGNPTPKGVTPEPGSIILLGSGLVVLGGVVRRKLWS